MIIATRIIINRAKIATILSTITLFLLVGSVSSDPATSILIFSGVFPAKRVEGTLTEVSYLPNGGRASM